MNKKLDLRSMMGAIDERCRSLLTLCLAKSVSWKGRKFTSFLSIKQKIARVYHLQLLSQSCAAARHQIQDSK
jgi:hypothetical protein